MFADIYLDVQGFVGSHNEFVPKEIALMWNEYKYHHFLIKEPYSYQELNNKLKKQAAWTTTNIHNLCWEEGEVSFNTIRQLIDEYVEFKFVCVRGVIKEDWVYKTFPNVYKVINMEGQNTLSFKELRQKYLDIKTCYLHNNGVCALQNTLLLYNYNKNHCINF